MTDPYLSKREYFAALAMQGLVINPERFAKAIKKSGGDPAVAIYPILATVSCKMADALIAALNQEPKP